MNQRFQNVEIKLVSEQYSDNELYKAVCSIGLQLENELKEFGLCSEECFMEALELLSVIAEKGENILLDIDNLWLRKENEYRRYDRKVSDDDIRKAVGIVFGFVILAIDSSQHPFYRRKLSESLTMVVANHKFNNWSATLNQIFSVPLPDGWFDAFIDEESEGNKELDAKSEKKIRERAAVLTENEGFMAIMEKAVEQELCMQKEWQYKWVNRGDSAYFASVASHKFELSKRHDRDGDLTISWKPFEALFGEKNLRSIYNDWQNGKYSLENKEKIDKLLR